MDEIEFEEQVVTEEFPKSEIEYLREKLLYYVKHATNLKTIISNLKITNKELTDIIKNHHYKQSDIERDNEQLKMKLKDKKEVIERLSNSQAFDVIYVIMEEISQNIEDSKVISFYHRPVGFFVNETNAKLKVEEMEESNHWEPRGFKREFTVVKMPIEG